MLRTFANEGEQYRMNIADAGVFDQRPFRSMLMRQYVVWDRRPNNHGKVGFKLTADGRQAFLDFETTNILRRVASMQLTSYFQVPRSALQLVKRAAS
jgi:hypothetical protein